MTEQKAIDIWRELDPLDATLRRMHLLGAEDPYEFDVLVEANPLSAAQVIEVIRTASARGLEVTVESECDRAILVIDSPLPEVVP